MRPIQQLALAADMLRRAAPGLYQDLVAAADACFDQSKDNLVAAPLEALPNQQGQAAAWRAVSQTLKDAHEIAAALKVKP